MKAGRLRPYCPFCTEKGERIEQLEKELSYFPNKYAIEVSCESVERNKYGFQELLSRVLMTKEIFRDHILLKQLARATAMDMQERIYEAIMKRAEELEREFAKAQQEQG